MQGRFRAKLCARRTPIWPLMDPSLRVHGPAGLTVTPCSSAEEDIHSAWTLIPELFTV